MITACPRRAVRCQVDSCQEADAAHIRDDRKILKIEKTVEEWVRQCFGAAEHILLLEDIERRQTRGTCGRMTRVGIAVEEIDSLLRRGIDDRLVDVLSNTNGTHRNGTVRHRLCHRDHIRLDFVGIGAKRIACSSEASNDFVKDQENAVFVANLAQAFQIPLRRQIRPDRTADRLNDAGGNRVTAIRITETLKIFRQFNSVRTFVPRILVLGNVGMTHMDDTRDTETVHFAVFHHASDGKSAKVDTVIAFLASNKPEALPFAFYTVIKQRNLQGRLNGFGTRTAVEDVIQVAR